MTAPARLASVRRHFSAQAEGYAASAHVQAKAATRLLEWISDPAPARILDAGCGPGTLTTQLGARFPNASIVGLDLAPGMIEFARSRTDASRIDWRVGDLMTFAAQDPFDLIVSNCALHWIADLDAAATHARSLVSQGGRAAISLMIEGTLGELHAARREVVPDVPPAGRLPTMARIVAALRSSRWSVLRAESATEVTRQPSARALIDHLRGHGVTGGSLSLGSRPLTRGELERLCAMYDQRYAESHGGVRATYSIAYLLAEAA